MPNSRIVGVRDQLDVALSRRNGARVARLLQFFMELFLEGKAKLDGVMHRLPGREPSRRAEMEPLALLSRVERALETMNDVRILVEAIDLASAMVMHSQRLEAAIVRCIGNSDANIPVRRRALNWGLIAPENPFRDTAGKLVALIRRVAELDGTFHKEAIHAASLLKRYDPSYAARTLIQDASLNRKIKSTCEIRISHAP